MGNEDPHDNADGTDLLITDITKLIKQFVKDRQKLKL